MLPYICKLIRVIPLEHFRELASEGFHFNKGPPPFYEYRYIRNTCSIRCYVEVFGSETYDVSCGIQLISDAGHYSIYFCDGIQSMYMEYGMRDSLLRWICLFPPCPRSFGGLLAILLTVADMDKKEQLLLAQNVCPARFFTEETFFHRPSFTNNLTEIALITTTIAQPITITGDDLVKIQVVSLDSR